MDLYSKPGSRVIRKKMGVDLHSKLDARVIKEKNRIGHSPIARLESDKEEEGK